MKAMKKNLLRALYAMAMVLTLSTLTGCDEDTQMSSVLSGQWYGDFGMFYEYDNGDRIYHFDCRDTHIYFEQRSSFSTHGWGKQVDFYPSGPYEYQYHYFEWTVRDGVLFLTYPYEPELDTEIMDYTISRGFFTGYFGNSHTKFYLEKEELYDWDTYSGYYYYDPRDDWYGGYYYAPAQTRSGDAASQQKPDESRIVRRGNRYNQPNQ